MHKNHEIKKKRSPIWAILLGLLHKMGMSVTVVARSLGILFAVLTVVVMGAFCAIYPLYIIYIGGDSAALFRFFIPLLPFLYILIQESSQLLTGAVLPVNRSHNLHVGVHYTLRGLLIVGALWPTLSPRGEHYKQFLQEKIRSLNHIQL